MSSYLSKQLMTYAKRVYGSNPNDKIFSAAANKLDEQAAEIAALKQSNIGDYKLTIDNGFVTISNVSGESERVDINQFIDHLDKFFNDNF